MTDDNRTVRQGGPLTQCLLEVNISRYSFIPVYHSKSVKTVISSLTKTTLRTHKCNCQHLLSNCFILVLISLLFALSFYCFSLTWKDECAKVTTFEDRKITTVKNGKETKPNKVPLTGRDVVNMFVKRSDPGESEVYYLKEVEGDSYRYPEIRLCTPLWFQIPVHVLMWLFHSERMHTTKHGVVSSFSDHMTCRWFVPVKLALSTTSSALILSYMWLRGVMVDL